MKSFFRILSTCALLSLTGVSADAAIITNYVGAEGGADAVARAAFRADIGTYMTESFSSETSNARFLDVNIENIVGDNHFTVFYTTTTGVNNSGIDIDGTDPDFELGLRTDSTGTDSITLLELRFNSPITGFGSEFRNLDARTQFLNRVTFTIPSQGSLIPADLLDPSNTDSGVSGFVGIITDSPFTVLRISSEQFGNDFFNMDDIDFSSGGGDPTPTPAIISIDVDSIVTLVVTGAYGTAVTPQYTSSIQSQPQVWSDVLIFNDVESDGTNTVTFNELNPAPDLLRVYAE